MIHQRFALFALLILICTPLTENMPLNAQSNTVQHTDPACWQWWDMDSFFKDATVIDVLHCVATGADINAQSDEGESPLHIAALVGNFSVPKWGISSRLGLRTPASSSCRSDVQLLQFGGNLSRTTMATSTPTKAAMLPSVFQSMPPPNCLPSRKSRSRSARRRSGKQWHRGSAYPAGWSGRVRWSPAG